MPSCYDFADTFKQIELGQPMNRHLIILATVLSALAPAHADPVDDFVRAEMERQKVPGLTLAVVRDGKVLKAKGYGLANVEHQVPAKRETVYQSGSLGKQFTATAVMLLVEEGKVELDDPVSKYLPGTPDSWQGVTVRHLLTHTAGIKDFYSAVNLREDYTEDDLLKKAFGFSPAFAPGEKWQYSNTGYVVLGILVSKVAGKFYGQVLKERAFDRLGMKTARIISEVDIIPNRAAGYRWVRGELKNQTWVSPTFNSTGDGSLYLTVDDLMRWDAALYTEEVLKQASLTQMWTPAHTKDGKPTRYGFGWAIEEVNGHQCLRHGGAWQGFTSNIDRYVDDKLTVIVLMNLAPPLKKGQPGGTPKALSEGVAALYEPALTPKKSQKEHKPDQWE
jgi:CubicO group peptidase (beta-lactamase class C family)